MNEEEKEAQVGGLKKKHKQEVRLFDKYNALCFGEFGSTTFVYGLNKYKEREPLWRILISLKSLCY